MNESMLCQIDHAPVIAEQGAGSGPPVVLLHAGVCDRRSWYGIVERLTECGQITAYDRRGFGDTPVSSEPFRHVDDLLTLLDYLDEPALVVGSSMGGQIAVDAALLQPDKIRGLVLIAPAISGAPDPSSLDSQTQQLSDLLDAAADAEDLAEVNRLETWLWLDGPASPEGRVSGTPRDLVLAMNEIVLRNDVPDTEGEGDLDAWQRLDNIEVPVTVLWGELDVPFLTEQCVELVQRIPHAQGQVLPALAHLPYLEDPALIAGIIRDCLFPAEGADGDHG